MVTIVSKPENKRTTCYQCKTVLEYQFNDMRFALESDYTGCRDRVARIQCPCCGAQTPVATIF